MRRLFMVCSVLVAVGCGGDGVSDSKRLSDLSTAEAKDLCLELVDLFPERTVTCSGQTVTTGIKASECNTPDPAPASCTATAGTARDCAEASGALSDAMICSGSIPPACAPLVGC